MSEGKIASIGVDSPEPAASASKYDRLIAEAKRSAAAKAIVVHPCDETSLRGAVEAAAMGLISATLVGPAAKINNVAREHNLDIGKCELVDVAHSDAAASKAVELIRAGQGELLMKGSLHTDELMRPVTASATGLRTERRISHVFIMDVPTYPETLFITDAAINIFPDLDAKRDIVQNAIDLFTQIGLGKPRVAILSAVETVTTKIPSTIDAAALCKMADRGQITGAILDGPLAFDNAIDPEAARIKGIHSPVAGRAQILVVPDLEAGNMLAKNLVYLSKADSARAGARCARAHRAYIACRLRSQPHGVVCRRRALCRGASQIREHHDRMSRMDAILVVNAGSSSVKFQIFEFGTEAPRSQLKGQMDGIGARPRLRAEASDGSPGRPKSYTTEIVDVPAAIAVAAEWLRQTPDIELIAVGHRVVHGGPDYDRPVLVDKNVLARLERLVALAPLHQPNNLALIRSLRTLRPGLVSGRLFRYGLSPFPQCRGRSLRNT